MEGRLEFNTQMLRLLQLVLLMVLRLSHALLVEDNSGIVITSVESLVVDFDPVSTELMENDVIVESVTIPTGHTVEDNDTSSFDLDENENSTQLLDLTTDLEGMMGDFSTDSNEESEHDESRGRHSRYRERFGDRAPGPNKSAISYRYPKPEFKQPPYQTANIPSFGSTLRSNLTKIENLKADCYSNHMRVSLNFNGSFNGLIYSTGYALDSECVYVNGTGATSYQFFIRLNRCGTLGHKPAPQKTVLRGYTSPVTQYGIPGETTMQSSNQFMFNSLTIQYNKLIEEEEDEQIRVSCEYGNDYWKTVNFPVVNVDSFLLFSKRINTGHPAVAFTLTPPQCTMEIKEGYGTTGNRISGPVTVGDSLTLMIHMKSLVDGFDIVVSNCVAHNGGQKKLQLIDANGCVLNEKLVSRFRGFNHVDSDEERVTLYAFLKAFRFTGSAALYLECDVRMCHGTCPAQRCYWRSLAKRSTDDEVSQPETILSESVSLVQALDVRHETSVEALESKNDLLDGSVCVRTATFTTLMSVFISLVILLILTSLWLCRNLRHTGEQSYRNRSFSPHPINKLIHRIE